MKPGRVDVTPVSSPRIPVRAETHSFARSANNPEASRVIPVFAGMILLTLAASNPAPAFDLRGHAKLQASATNLPDDSLLQDFSNDPMRDEAIDLRFNLTDRSDDWSWHADYQLSLIRGDRVELRQSASLPGFTTNAAPDDERRVFDLSHRASDDRDRIVAHRLDRLYLGHTSTKTVVNIGRQVVSWGNGLVYNPMDFFNPFDPAAIDTEYKTGDDMLYAQYLLDSGDDLQAVWVGRRDADDEISPEVSSLAFKYHRFSNRGEFDLLVAEHYDAGIAALGGAADFAEAVWRGDLMLTDDGGERFASAVLNWSYSWIAWQKNLSATLEYFHNGFGIDDGDYGPRALTANPELAQRLSRGEVFTLAQNYIAATATLEMAPLWLLTATIFQNLDDDSLLLQVFSRHDLQQDLQLLVALNLPHGSDGSEFGGVDSGLDDRPLAIGASLSAQLAWYF